MPDCPIIIIRFILSGDFLHLLVKDGLKLVVFASGILLCLSSSASMALTLSNLPPELKAHSTLSSTRLDKQRKLFLQAESHLKLGRFTQYRKIEHRLNDYPLYPYLRFIELERNLKNTSTKKIQTFRPGSLEERQPG